MQIWTGTPSSVLGRALATMTLVVAVAGQNVPRGPYSEPVYMAAHHVVEAYQTGLYAAGVERLRQIGLTIDPATAETMFWYADVSDPYDILDERYFTRIVSGEFGLRAIPVESG